jgi:GntR family transcriptional repressor for pyruvate dehydrogenase complex
MEKESDDLMATNASADDLAEGSSIFGLDRSQGGSVSQATAALLQTMIEEGRLAVGAALPPQRELARELSVSRASLREAMSTLAAKGLLSIEQGRGTFVRSRAVAEPEPAQWRFSGQYSPAEVFQFRYIAESHAAQLAAMNHTQQDIDNIRSNLDAFRQAVRDADIVAFARVDFEFHHMIIRFSQNRLLADMHRDFSIVLSESQRLPLDKKDLLWDAVNEHERIAEALDMSDPAGAAYYMRQHLSRAGNRAGITFIELG